MAITDVRLANKRVANAIIKKKLITPPVSVEYYGSVLYRSISDEQNRSIL